MTETEARILQNQVEIMWTLHYLLECAKPSLVGHNGELDRMRADLAAASKDTVKLVEAPRSPQETTRDGSWKETPEQRFDRVRAWIVKQIKVDSVVSPAERETP